MANRMAMPCPTVAAIWVARAYGSRRASSARSTRPPSMGNAGSRLKATSTTLTHMSWLTRPPPTRTASESDQRLVVSRSETNRATAITTLTAGPASATHSSWPGSSGIRSRRATPPTGARGGAGAALDVQQHDPADQQQEGPVDEDPDPGDRADSPGPLHAALGREWSRVRVIGRIYPVRLSRGGRVKAHHR